MGFIRDYPMAEELNKDDILLIETAKGTSQIKASKVGGGSTITLIDNLETDEPGLGALDAYQGKLLKDDVLIINDSLNHINVYVGSDGKLHFVDKDGADTPLPFKKTTVIASCAVLSGSTTICTASYYTYNDSNYCSITASGSSAQITITIKKAFNGIIYISGTRRGSAENATLKHNNTTLYNGDNDINYHINSYNKNFSANDKITLSLTYGNSNASTTSLVLISN